MKITKAIRPAMEYAKELGYQASRTRGGHLRFTKPGRRSVITSSTPSDWRTTRNVISQLRKSAEGRL